MSLSTRLTIAIVALVVATAGTVGFLSFRSVAVVAIPRALVRLEAHARALAVDMANVTENARADLKGLRRVVGVDELAGGAAAVQPGGGPAPAQWRERIARLFAAEIEAK